MTTTNYEILKQQWVESILAGWDTEAMSQEEINEQLLGTQLGEGTFPSVQEYIDAGVSPTEYRAWYSVNGFCIDSMKELEQAFGSDIDWLGERSWNKCGYEQTLAYQYCNGDITIEELQKIQAVQ